MSEKTITHVYVTSEVQGVGFRYWAHREASETGISGWIRNLPDGRVEAVFEGDPDSVEEMVERCRRGPSSARVTDVEIDERPDIERGFEGFEVR